jgi:glucose-1-phosphate adenylyltransferase
MLKELTQYRCISALPIGAKYRIVDFILSNMVNSGISNVSIITQHNPHSLIEHVKSGNDWNLNKKNANFHILTPDIDTTGPKHYKGSADALFQNLESIKKSNHEHILICEGNAIYKMQYQDMLKYHIEKNADITVAYKEMNTCPSHQLSHLGVIETQSDRRVLDYQQKPFKPKTSNATIGIYIINKTLLTQLLEESAETESHDLIKDIIIKKVNYLNIYGYQFKEYWQCLNSVDTYYKCNMDFLNPHIQHELFMQNGWVYTRKTDEPPAQYHKGAKIYNSLIGNGSIIKGTVKNSIIFGRVIVEKGAVIKNSIVIHDSVISQDTIISNAILDNEVTLSKGRYIRGEINLPILIGSKVSA